MSGSSNNPLGGATRCGRVLAPCLDKIIKNVAWRRHSHLVAASKSAIDKLQTLTELPSPSPSSPIPSLSDSDADSLLYPLLLAIETASPKVVDPALSRLFSLNLIRFDFDNRNNDSNANSVVFKLVESVCNAACSLGDEGIEIGVMKVLLSALRSPVAVFRRDYLNDIVKICYNVYLGGLNGTNQICAKAVLAQIVLIVFARVEQDSMFVANFKTVVVSELLEFNDRNLSEGNSVQLVQNLINEVMEGNEGVEEIQTSENGNAGDDLARKVEEKGEGGSGNGDMENEMQESQLREDGFMLFKNLCKLSMKFSSMHYTFP